MAKRKKKKKRKKQFDPAEQARRLSRALFGTPPAERTFPPKKNKQKQPKHKKREIEREWE